MEIHRDRTTGRLWLSQDGYMEKVLERFNMTDAKPEILRFDNHRSKVCVRVAEQTLTHCFGALPTGRLSYLCSPKLPSLTVAVRPFAPPRHLQSGVWRLRRLRPSRLGSTYEAPSVRSRPGVPSAQEPKSIQMKFLDWYLKISLVSAMVGASMEMFMIKTGFYDKVTVLESEKQAWEGSPEAQAIRDALNPWRNHDVEARKNS
ncbi:retrovirus-related Pol polyprotein from transposon TNT 1-94 [Malania oleifera]|uniref:retrovirus-related Pol polyprotein from transposon TNT 1-94 n=1 Tax=Malania oleifera TaxID=397392 RepID=UPI0025AE3BB1|nr:retrovirus-related Pol polyprotein from transposon TNT 1-94 [Malania oleifera]